jgi:WD40 repeat protein
MLVDTVNADRIDDPAATQPPSPSAAGPTRTGASDDVRDPPRDLARPVPGTRPHDPERYQVLGEHGRGGLGRVSRAHDLDLGRDIAIKELISRGSLRELRFLREALITARLQHPGIVPVYEAGCWPDGTPFYAMKLVSGRSLRDLVAERTTIEQRIGLLHHVIAVADAIAYAHGRNIIHRDLKPGNVIVGEFGETIVIDWGLAKEMTAAEQAPIAGGPFRTTRDDELTSAGSILGTPAYMAPEQRRGEHVDQRADVFAIGAMLWELCAMQREPPDDPRERHRVLGRAGIDPDLATIIVKALDPDPAHRYPHAGALAADLKAFKSGARITARSYSLLGMLGHWTRRHRALALSVGAAIALATAGGALYVHNIETERDRAEASGNRLLLEHAELLLRGDPTAAFELLETYRGTDTQRLAMLRARAQGLGLSRLRARPHTQAIFFAHALPDGAVITLGGDGTVARTTPAGLTQVIARGGSPRYSASYSDARHLLAYACHSAAICLLDIETQKPLSPPIDGPSLGPAGLALSPRGELLAAISAHGETVVWQLLDGRSPTIRYRVDVAGGEAIRFIDEHTIAARTADRVQLIHLDTHEHPQARNALAIAGMTDMTTSENLHLAAVSSDSGALVLISADSDEVVYRDTVCRGIVNSITILPERPAVAYGCQDGDAGVLDLRHHNRSTIAYLEGGVTTLAGSRDGRYLLIGGNNGRLMTYDFTSQMASSYIGHATRITTLVPSTREFPYLVSGDVSGVIRTWPLPDVPARVAIKTAALMAVAILLPNHGPLIGYGDGPTIPWFALDGSSGELGGHSPSRAAIALSATRARFATYGVGLDDVVELWSFEPGLSSTKIKTAHGAVIAAGFEFDGDHLIIGALDGAITRWSIDDSASIDLGTIHEPVHLVRAVPNTGMTVIGGASGALWISDKTTLSYLGKEPSSFVTATCSDDSTWLAVATSKGTVRLYNLMTRESMTIANSQWISYLAFSPDSHELAIVTESKVIVVAVPAPDLAYEIDVKARSVALSPDGKWLAMTCEHGDIWFYRRADDHFVYLSTGSGNIPFGRFSGDGQHFTAADRDGRALLIDMHAPAFH